MDDFGLIVDVGRGDDVLRQLGDVHHTASILQAPLRLQVLGHGDDVHRPLVHLQGLNGLVDHLMPVVVERLGREQVLHLFVRLLLHEQGAQDGSLEVELLRLFVSVGIHLWHLHHLAFLGSLGATIR